MKKIGFTILILLAIACGGSNDQELIDYVTEDSNTPASEDPNGSDGDSDSSDGDNGNVENSGGDSDSEGSDSGNGDNGDGSSDNGDDSSTNTPPSATTLVYPLNKTECSNSNLTFSWNESTDADGDIITYTLTVDTSPNFNDSPEVYDGISDTNYTLDLPISTALYWRVESKDAQATTASETWSLYTQGQGINNTVPQLEYISPLNNESFVNGLNIMFEWRGTDAETPNQQLVYDLYLSEVGQELTLRLNDITQTSFTDNDLNRNTTYQWAVSVTDGNGATNFGDVYTFTVQ